MMKYLVAASAPRLSFLRNATRAIGGEPGDLHADEQGDEVQGHRHHHHARGGQHDEGVVLAGMLRPFRRNASDAMTTYNATRQEHQHEQGREHVELQHGAFELGHYRRVSVDQKLITRSMEAAMPTSDTIAGGRRTWPAGALRVRAAAKPHHHQHGYIEHYSRAIFRSPRSIAAESADGTR